MALTKKKIWAYEDYYYLEDDKRYEIIEGELIPMAPAPRSKHQIILANLLFLLQIYIKKKESGLVIPSPIDVIFDDQNVLQPDIVYITSDNKDIIKERGIFGSPDLVIEILSPSTKNKDREKKYRIYERFSVQEYWIVDPDNESIEVFALDRDKYIRLCSTEGQQNIKSILLEELKLNYHELID